MSGSDTTNPSPEGCGHEATRKRRGLCPTCYRRWWKDSTERGEFDSLRTDAAPVQEHVAALVSSGMTLSEIAQAAGVELRRIENLANDSSDRGKPIQHVYKKIAEPILAVEVPGPVIAALGTIRRLRALVTIGYPLFELAHRLKVEASELDRIVMRRPTVVSDELAAAVRALYDLLHAVPGPNDAARRYGRQHEWAAPFAWEDTAALDDPKARPEGVPRKPRGVRPVIPKDFPEMVADHRALGHSDVEIAAAMEISLEALQKRYHKFGIEPQAAVAS